MPSRFMPKLATVCALLLTFTLAPVHAQNLINILNTDQEFVPAAMHDGSMEAADAQLAQQRGVSAAVRSYAASLLVDYSPANTELASLAQTKNIALVPQAPVPAAVSDTTVVTRDTQVRELVVRSPAPYGVGGRMPPDRGFEQENGPAFDRSYMRYEIQQHLIDIALYQDEIATGKDVDLVAHASAMLPKLIDQLHAAQRFMGVPEAQIPS